MRVGHLVHHLNPFGTERVILSLLSYRSPQLREQFVVSSEDGPMAQAMRATGCEVFIEPSLAGQAARLKGADLVNAHCLYVENGEQMREAIRAAGRDYLFTLHWPIAFPSNMSPLYICTSVAAYRAQRPTSRCALIENGIDLEAFFDPPARQRPADDGRFLITRVCRPEKCDEYFWYAMADLYCRHPEVEIRIVGNQWPSPGRVHALGVRSDIPALLADADLVVYVPRPNEGTRDLAVMEAMAMGVPGVFSDVPAVRSSAVHGKTALLVPFGDTEALTAAVEALIRDPQLRRTLGAQARKHALERFDVRPRVAAYEQLYHAFLRGELPDPAPTAAPKRQLWGSLLARWTGGTHGPAAAPASAGGRG